MYRLSDYSDSFLFAFIILPAFKGLHTVIHSMKRYIPLAAILGLCKKGNLS